MSSRFSQPITGFTGLPGHGKTLAAITYAVEARKEGQRVFQIGIRDCNPAVAELWCPTGIDSVLMANFDPGNEDARAERLAAFSRWRELPSGAVLIVDEAQDYLPVRGPGRPVEWIAELARLRHFGVQLWLVTQDIRNIDSFVRRLVCDHVHIERKSGSKTAVVFRWPKVCVETDDYHARKRADKSALRQRKEMFQFYTSATQHLVKRKIPWQLWLAVPVVVGMVVAVFFAYRLFTGHDSFSTSSVHALASGGGSAVGSTGLGGVGLATSLSPGQYAIKFVPRFASMPWSAPAFDDRKVVSQPELFCVNSELKGCRCYSEQVTLVKVTDLECLTVVRDGQYNPFRPPAFRERDRDRDRSRVGGGDLRDGGSFAGVSAGPAARSGVVSSSAVSSVAPVTTEWPRPDFSYRVPFPSPSPIGSK